MNEFLFNSSKKLKDKQLKGTKNLDNTLSTSIAYKTFNSINSRADNTQRTYTSKDNPEFDNYNDEDEYDNFFIDPEYQKLIFELLQMVRKKVKNMLYQKINPQNAFEVPLTVLNPEATQSIDIRFWKFASQLLNASMYVYDKRVENTFQTTHKVFNNLMRSQNNQQISQEKSQTRSKKKNAAQFFSEQILQIGSYQFVTSIKICQDSNREDPEKLNIKGKNCIVSINPYFAENSKKFDSHSLQNLFLNVLQQNCDLQINIIKPKIQPNEEMKPQKSFQSNSSCQQIQFSAFISQNIAQLSIDLKSNSLFDSISKFAESKLDHTNISLVSDIIRDIEADCEAFTAHTYSSGFNDSQITSLGSNFGLNSNKFSFNFVTNPQIGKNLSEQINNQEINSNQFKSEKSSNNQIELLFIQNDDYVLTPGEFQFRNLNLIKQKKKKIRSIKDIKSSKIIAKNNEDINFNTSKNQSISLRQDILMIETHQLKIYQSKGVYQQSNIHSINLYPYIGYYRVNNRLYSKQSQQHQIDNYFKAKGFIQQQLTDIFPLPNSMLIDHNNQTNICAIQNNESNQSSSFPIQDHSLSACIPNFGYRYIRNIKTLIVQQINTHSQALLSNMDSNMSVASTFIVFLHLVNQKMLAIQSLNDDSDIRLYKGQDGINNKIKGQI